MSFGKYILRGKEPVPVDDVLEWGRNLGNAENRRVAFDKIGDEAEVSTVFLSLDHSFGHGAPLLFETLVFGGKLDGEQDRYSTWDEAEAGHRAMVERVRASMSDDHSTAG